MKRLLAFFPFFFWALMLLFCPAPCLAGDSKAGTSNTLKEKAKEEMESVEKDTQKIGQEFKESARELPTQAGKEFKKTGSSLKEAGKELKESAKETVGEIKKMFQK